MQALTEVLAREGGLNYFVPGRNNHEELDFKFVAGFRRRNFNRVQLLPAGFGCGRDKSSGKTLPLKVVGTKILDSNNQPVRLRGVNAASMEWTSNGEGHILQTVNVAIHDWHVNIIRLPLSQDRWFGKAPEQNGDSKPYRDLVSQVVEECATQNCYIILDLHWSDCNEWGRNIGRIRLSQATQNQLSKSSPLP